MDLTVQRDFSAVSAEQAAGLVGAFPSLRSLVKQPSPRIAIKAKGKILFINLDDVVAVEAEGNYVLLKRDASSFLLRESISLVLRSYLIEALIKLCADLSL